ncbi:hypothetical protein E5S70_38985 [Ensifer adhaerens]|uniref:hypothetical protein n=1 Tax=Ensifer canadensis TaxID=555315 RepID=UPI00148F7E8E|nr:hypothetical protein [Ensifer canadensis]NOV21873.1 hypothetical protein [Ensifer canadensis]
MKIVGRTGRTGSKANTFAQQNNRNDTATPNARSDAVSDGWPSASDSDRACRGDSCAGCSSCSTIDGLEITGLKFFLTDDALADPEALYLGVRLRDLALLPGVRAIHGMPDGWLVNLASLCGK